MNSNTLNKKLTNEEKRLKIVEVLEEAFLLKERQNFVESEKKFLKASRIAENVYRQTMSTKDFKTLIDTYIKICDFYENDMQNLELLQRWYQKIVHLKDSTCEIRTTLDDYHQLLEWYTTTLLLAKRNEDYEHLISLGIKMRKRAKILYQKTKTNEDIKFIILSEIFIAEGYEKLNKLFKAYHYYYIVAKKMEKIYSEINDEGLKYDLIEIYQNLINLSSKKIFRPISKRWSIKKLLLKGENTND